MEEQLQQQLVRELVIESLEGLDTFNREILALEKGEQSVEAWNNAFRAIHTIKGSSGCVGFSKIESVAHAGESLLAVLRDGGMSPDPRTASTLFRYSDTLREILQTIERTGTEGPDDYTSLIADLKALHAAITGGKTTGPSVSNESFGLFEEEPETHEKPQTENKQPAAPRPDKGGSQKPAASETAIRVDVGQIDRLMNLVGELVLARNQVVQSAGQQADPALAAAVQRVNLITSELQESVMKTRMQPISSIWSRFPKIVRDLSYELGKDVTLLMEGSETELDRTIIEAVRDPLTHIVRNAIDHGIELPEQRSLAAKNKQGRLVLRAFHEGGQVNIEISDDGKGIDASRVLAKAVERGLVTQEQGSRMSHREMLALIFLPGLSTAEKLTSVSGRGVGMDVVRNNIEKIGGTVDLRSDPGQGTSIRIRIPLTLAIIPALIVTSGGDRYAIPAASLVELVRIEGDLVGRAIEHIHDAPVYRLRGTLLPLLDLAKELDLISQRHADDALFMIVLQAEDRRFGLIVDAVNDTEEIVVKPLGREMKGLTTYAGATIMGDGKVALILDVLGLARRAALLNETTRHNVAGPTGAELSGGNDQEEQSLLLARVGGRRIAIPLACVARLEEIDAGSIEYAGGSEVIQYRGRIMNLLRLNTVLREGTSSARGGAGGPDESGEAGRLRLIVCTIETDSLGVIVDSIDDIVEDQIQIRVRSKQPGVLGSAVVHQKVTDLLDIAELARIGP